MFSTRLSMCVHVCIYFNPAETQAAVQVLIKGKALPGTPDIVHDRFLECVEKEDAKGAMAHFAFIACEGGALLTLRRRQLLVILCEKGMVKEASELLTSAIASPAFDSQDLSTIVRATSTLSVCVVVRVKQNCDSGSATSMNVRWYILCVLLLWAKT